MKHYYYVYRYGNKAPKVKHPTLELAVKEAERLASENIGESFEILKAVAISRVQAPARTVFLKDDSFENKF